MYHRIMYYAIIYHFVQSKTLDVALFLLSLCCFFLLLDCRIRARVEGVLFFPNSRFAVGIYFYMLLYNYEHIYIYIHIHIHTSLSLSLCVYMYIYIYMCIYIYIYTYMCVYVYIYIYIHMLILGCFAGVALTRCRRGVASPISIKFTSS